MEVDIEKAFASGGLVQDSGVQSCDVSAWDTTLTVVAVFVLVLAFIVLAYELKSKLATWK